MKLLIVSSSAPFGRGESFVISEANEIARQGWDVTLFPAVVRKGSPNRFELHSRCNLLSEDTLVLKTVLTLCRHVIRYPVRTTRIFRRLRAADLQTTIKNWIIVPRTLWLIDHLSANPVDHIHSHWLSTPATLAMVVSELTGIPWSSTGHRSDIVSNNLLSDKFNGASFLRFISQSGIDLAKARAHLPPYKTNLIHLGVALPDVTESDKSHAASDESANFCILCPANLVPVKGHEVLFRALAAIGTKKSVQVLLAGAGPLEKSLKALAAEFGLEAMVRFLGHVPHSSLLEFYRQGAVDLVVLPSQDLGHGEHEGIPVSLMEAMSFRVPVISTRTGGIPELLEDGEGRKYGELIEAKDWSGLAKMIERLISSPEGRAEIGMLGFQRISAQFDIEKNVARVMEKMTI